MELEIDNVRSAECDFENVSFTLDDMVGLGGNEVELVCVSSAVKECDGVPLSVFEGVSSSLLLVVTVLLNPPD